MDENNKNKVLVVDDNEVIRRLATTLLTKKNYEVTTAENGKIAIDTAKSFRPDVILLDVMMPEMDGHEACRHLKSDKTTKDIPIIMVTSKTDSVDKIRGLEIGAADYVTKPFDHGELQARVETQIKMKNLWDELQKKNRMLEELIKKDGLTNLFNHRHFQESILDEYNRARRYAYPLGCVLLDIDHFKKINDTHGHQAGDDILKSLAAILQNSIRDVDMAARYGGEEFAITLPHTDLEESLILAERIRENVEKYDFIFNGTKIYVTISLGIASMPENSPESHSELIRFADEALYTAKENGRNRVETYS